jgi:hypothetical protein
MHTNLDYFGTDFKNKEEMFTQFCDILDHSQEEFLERVRGVHKMYNDQASQRFIDRCKRERDLFQKELENMLEAYDLEKMFEFNYSLENFICFGKKFPEKNGQIWELIYWYVFHDQPGYRPELIRTPLEVLKKTGFGLAK